MRNTVGFWAYLHTHQLITRLLIGLFIGTINNSVIHPKDIFNEAYLVTASGIICIHNHPSGDATPSKEDILVTKKLQELGIIHGIKIVDHIIIGNNNYYSFLDDKKL